MSIEAAYQRARRRVAQKRTVWWFSEDGRILNADFKLASLEPSRLAWVESHG